MKSIKTSFTNLISRDLARVRKIGKCYIMPLPQLSYIYWLIYFNYVLSSDLYWKIIISIYSGGCRLKFSSGPFFSNFYFVHCYLVEFNRYLPC